MKQHLFAAQNATSKHDLMKNMTHYTNK